MSKKKIKRNVVLCADCKKERDPLALVTLPGIRDKDTGEKVRVCNPCVIKAHKKILEGLVKNADDKTDTSSD